MRRLFLLLLVAGLSAALVEAASKQTLLNSKHDFRARSSAAIRSVSEADACIFCHTPHNAGSAGFLWNQRLSTAEFPTYQSSTLQATVSPMGPEDASKLCLSCHDGTIALGDTLNDGLIWMLPSEKYLARPTCRRL